ncbi:hypothetical protein ALC62_02169, partial [Cyphomyrmex costatus]
LSWSSGDTPRREEGRSDGNSARRTTSGIASMSTRMNERVSERDMCISALFGHATPFLFLLKNDGVRLTVDFHFSEKKKRKLMVESKYTLTNY